MQEQCSRVREGGTYWPIFNKCIGKAPIQVATVKPLQLQETTVQDTSVKALQVEETAVKALQVQVTPCLERDPKAAHVPCLMSHAVLASLCSREGCKFNQEPCHTSKEDFQRLLPFGSGVYPDEFEIEEILDHKTINGTMMYYIKWKDWDSLHNTWEPRTNLENSHRILDAYNSRLGEIHRLKRMYGTNYLSIMERKVGILDIIRDACDHRDFATLQKLYGKRSVLFNDSKNAMKNIKKELLDSVDLLSKDKKKQSRCTTSILDLLKSESDFKDLVAFAKKRLDVLYNLKQWESDINGLPGVKAPVKVENHIDLEGPPKNFTFISDYDAGPGIVLNDDPPIGCECTAGCYENRKACCPAMSGSHFVYNRSCTLTVLPGSPIYECNKRCSCPEDCPNRVVQKGRTVPLTIFRTDNGRGWGVKTMEKIRKGAFVLEYIGQIITSEEAEIRGKVYDAQGSTYLFDLDFDGHNEYTVDAGAYGNVAHFINHSCEPNLVVYAVWINNLDPKLPRIAFFSNQEIRRGEELTFDYIVAANPNELPSSPPIGLNTSFRLGSSGPKQDDCPSPPMKMQRVGCSEKTENVSRITKTDCKCGSKKCRKFLFK